jgi:putative ABC transport system permease protein
MKILTWFGAIFIIAAKRLYAQLGLSLATLFGLVVTVGLTLSVPLYTDAVYYRLLRESLTGQAWASQDLAAPLPLTFLVRYVSTKRGPVSWEEIQPVDAYLASPAARLDLPARQLVRHFKTENFRLFPQQNASYSNAKNALAWVKFGFLSDLEHHITLVEGDWPAVAAVAPDSSLEVLVNEALATELGMQVGESYLTFNRQETENGSQTTQAPIKVVGIWRTPAVANEFWRYNPGSPADLFLVPEETFVGRIGTYLADEVFTANWYLVLDGATVRSADAGPLLRQITAMQQQLSALLPDTTLDVSPARALQQYRSSSNFLTVMLYAFSIPILLLLLIFMALVTGLALYRQRNEIAVLRSRGATSGQLIAIAAVQGSILGGGALLLGLPLGVSLAKMIGQTRSFLNFDQSLVLPVTITGPILLVGLITVGLTLTFLMIPTLGAARQTIVSYKQNQARAHRPVWWQRAGLDLLLLIPAAYGAYLLQQQGSIIWPGSEALTGETAFQNPLLLLVPALAILALTLLFLRLLPPMMTFLAWLVAALGGVGLLLATRQLARSPGFYTAPMVLLVLTLSLSAFTASLAQTLDNHLFDQVYYQVGADISLVDSGLSTSSADPFAPPAEPTPTSTARDEPRWVFLPVSDYLETPGVTGATRVVTYEAVTSLSGARQEGTFLGLEWGNFPWVAYWRADFSPSYLIELTNALALTPEGVLLPRNFLRQHALNRGDRIQVEVRAYGEKIVMPMQVVGSFDLFPTWYPDDGPIFVGNLEYFFEQAGGQFPYNVWLKTDPQANYQRVTEAMRQSELQVLTPNVSLALATDSQLAPERQGLFGVLSVGFIASALLTVLGFMLYTLFSFRQRVIELGVLRAIGLSSGQMTLFLAWELIFLISSGLLLGTFLGAWTSQFFIPFLQVGSEVAARTPPFLVEIAWPAIFRIYLLFGLLFAGALLILVTFLLRMKIFQAIKLGETV